LNQLFIEVRVVREEIRQAREYLGRKLDLEPVMLEHKSKSVMPECKSKPVTLEHKSKSVDAQHKTKPAMPEPMSDPKTESERDPETRLEVYLKE